MKSCCILLLLVILVTPVFSQNVGIGTANPLARLHVTDSNVVFSAPNDLPGTSSNAPIEGPGRRMLWFPNKAAFRVGYTSAAQWDGYNIGMYSFAAGNSVMASGLCASAFGYESVASGTGSIASGLNAWAAGSGSVALGNYALATQGNTVALGGSTSAYALNAVAIGLQSTANGVGAVALGRNTADGQNSFAAGYFNKAKSAYGAVVGIYNDTSNTNRLFEVGNGTSNTSRSNALTVLANGKLGIGATNPSRQAEIVGPASGNPVTLMVGNRGGFGPAAIELVSDYGLASEWRPGFIRSNDGGGFTGAVEILTNGTGAGNLYGAVKGLEVRNGITYTATGTVSSFSDRRLKKDIVPFTEGLQTIMQINPVRFYYNEDAPFKTTQQQVGVIAQELEQLAPYMVETTTSNDLKAVNNQAYVFLLINAVKEQQQKIEQLEKEINNLKEKKYSKRNR